MHLFEMMKRFRKGVIIAASLVIIENVAWILEPALFGNVIDALIDKATAAAPLQKGAHVLPLLIWIFVFIINSGTGVIRRIWDQKIFLRIFTQIATEISETAQREGYSVSKTAALAQLSEQYITFFEYRMPEITEQIIAIGGAVIALATFDWRISLTCLTIVLPLLLINQVYNKKVSSLQKDLHDIYESTYDVFSRQQSEEVRAYYATSARFKQKIANWGALNFGMVRGALLLIFLAVLYIAIDLDNFSTGEIYAIASYIWTFVTTSEYIPELMESYTSLKDISRRIQE
ncbi:MAG: hypothetical protein HY088_08310 [Ignavibacteriales bacterium]|nr:hypothetical protein [Ignavibacteriales bacterium]